MITSNPIVIVGAGLSGLRAASLLTAQGIPCCVLEAQERIGGRVLSQNLSDHLELGKFDLGPTWFWPQYEPIITKLANELGLETFTQYNMGSMISERTQEQSPQQHMLPYGAIETSMRFIGGAQTLIEALAATLPDGVLKLNQRVTLIHQQKDGSLGIEVEGNGTITARAVLIAIPPRVAVKTIKFIPELPVELINSLMDKPTWMASQAKIVAIYERPFWREQGLSGFATSWVGPLQEIHDASPASGCGALFGFFRVPAHNRADLGEEAITELVVAQLVRLFGPQANDTMGILYKDWAIEPEVAVTEDLIPFSEYPNYGVPVGEKNAAIPVVFTSTETANIQGGHLEGALWAAERAVSQLIERIKMDS
ncbi:FAD-dependent oxidoreductase [Paenibacillus polymyxa]|uniref:flavin monoamine oxidase family protein n=1 Tax=Paenibacillus polymyxa TaxID=1406 RepID=UPI002AB49C8C|nr:FAD-dependent oxidoreductase [Paenibacillus polymyxa]MDY8094894.1 FAD-dependent oxidoreductase [Paenibacillus polymyxa]